MIQEKERDMKQKVQRIKKHIDDKIKLIVKKKNAHILMISKSRFLKIPEGVVHLCSTGN